jgi:hypothetical protein
MYDVQIGASNTKNFMAESLDELNIKLRSYNKSAQCSVLDLDNNYEVFYGSVRQVIDFVKLTLNLKYGR